MEITNTINIGDYVVMHDLPNGSSLVGTDLDYVSESDEPEIEFEFDEATI